MVVTRSIYLLLLLFTIFQLINKYRIVVNYSEITNNNKRIIRQNFSINIDTDRTVYESIWEQIDLHGYRSYNLQIIFGEKRFKTK